jgi:hypothetical protein
MVEPILKTDNDRKSMLARGVSAQVAQGWRVESQGDFTAVMVKGHRPNHILHVILSVLTLGIWLIPWAAIAALGGETRQMVEVDEYGNTRIAQL